MRAIISGAGGAYVLEEGRTWKLGRRGHSELTVIGSGDVARVLGSVGLVELKNVDQRTVERRLEVEWSKDRALRLMIMLLDPEEPEAGLQDAVPLLERLLNVNSVADYLENQFLQHPLPETAERQRALQLVADAPASRAFINRVLERQSAVDTVYQAFDRLDDQLFDDDGKKQFRERAIEVGGFSALVHGTSDEGTSDGAILTSFQRMARLSHSREVVKAWTADLRTPSHERLPPLPPELEDRLERDVAEFGGGPGGHARMRNAVEQQEAALERVAAGDYDTARHYVDDLSRQQIANGGAAYLAMSLTRLSQRAREMEAFELAFEWAARAAETSPNDPRTRTQLADALLALERVDAALAEYMEAERLGEAAYATGGRARVMRLLGEHEEQLKLQLASEVMHGESEDRIHAMIGVSTALRDLHRIDDAIEKIVLAENEFPYDHRPRIAHARTLVLQGKFEEAWGKFDEAAGFTSDKRISLNGFAEICRLTGRLSEARKRYAELTLAHPRDVSPRLGLIDTLRDLGMREQAAIYARRTAERFPGSPRAVGRHAATLSEVGRHIEARRLFSSAVIRFPRDVRLYVGQVHAAGREARLDHALKLIDIAYARFPYSRLIRRTRADMLRRLGSIDEAASLYRDLVAEDAFDDRSRNGLAAALILKNTPEEAQLLVKGDNPRTAAEWDLFFLLATCIESIGDSQEARQRLSWAHDTCPFFRQRRKFGIALARFAIQHAKARKAPRIEQVPESDIGNIVDFQVAAATRHARAGMLYGRLQRNISPFIAEIRDEIARNYQVINQKPTRSKAWIGRKLSEEMLRAA